MEADNQFKFIPQHVVDAIIYDPESGKVAVYPGFRVRTKKNRNILETPEDGEFALSRVIWKHKTGEDPEDKVVDHISGDQFNHKWNNLRLATRVENSRNRGMGKNNTSGVKGVYWDKRNNLWRARLTHRGKLLFSKYYREDELEQAKIDIDEARTRIYGEFAANHR